MDTVVPASTTTDNLAQPRGRLFGGSPAQIFGESLQNARYDLVEAVPDLRARLDAIVALCDHSRTSVLFDAETLLAGCRGHAERALDLLDAAC